jgi:NAD(P)-dependent dehydrogenase (short-subunit alcohol dehydrogenase family)
MPERDLFDLRDRIVVVTGALGQLGRQFSRSLHNAGCKVAALDRRAGEADRREAFGDLDDSPNLLLVEADVTSRSSLEAALGTIENTWGTPYGLVNNAGLDSPPGASGLENGPFETYPESSWDKVMEVNAKGVFLCCQVFGGAMAQDGAGAIVNVGSIYGCVSPDQSLYEYRSADGDTFFKPVAYAASKSALLNLTRYLATYWALKGVRVNTVTFGGVFNDQDERFLENYGGRVPLGRMAREDEYNGAVIFLLSDAASYMTGSNMIIDGGWTAL